MMNNSEDLEESSGPQYQHRLFSFLFRNKRVPIPTDDERLTYPEYDANIISRIFFWWLVPVMKVGYQRTLEPNDLFVLTPNVKVENMYQKFHQKRTKWSAKVQNKLSSKLLYFIIVVNTYNIEFLASCLFMSLSNIGSALNPLVSRELIKFVEEKNHHSYGKGVGLAIGTALLVCVSGVLMNHSLQKSMLVGAKSRGMLVKAIIEKSYKLSEKSRHLYPEAKITSLVGADASRVDQALGMFPVLVAFPIILIIAIVILIVNIGVSALVGIGILVVYLIVLTYSTLVLVKMRKGINPLTDSRVYFISEVLNNLKMIKLYSWEIPYLNRIAQIRESEMFKIFKVQALRNSVLASSITSTNIISMASFLTIYGIKGSMDSAANIFSSLSLFNILTQVIYVLPVALSSSADAFVALGRIGDYLDAEESLEIIEKLHEIEDQSLAIQVKDGSFQWENFEGEGEDEDEDNKGTSLLEEKDDLTEDLNSEKANVGKSNIFTGLYNVNFDIKKGEFIVITGVVGSGKTSLLYALSGIMKKMSGDIGVNGSSILCGTLWIQNATIRDNILFGSEYEKDRYNSVLNACSLIEDIENFQSGDLTEVGERGITLSGGQKARINLARAVYSDSDVILMDDVLSAVDAKVGKHIVYHCFMQYLKNKTRILATHQLSLIGNADRIIFINADSSLEVGTYDELNEKCLGFSTLIKNSNIDITNDEKEEEVMEEEEQKPRKAVKKDTLMQKEDREVNGISFDVYKMYLRYGSGKWGTIPWLCVYLIVTTLATFAQIFTGVWLSFWIEDKFKTYPAKFYIGLYVMFAVLSVLLVIFEFILLVQLTNNASKTLHINALRNVLHTPMSFMDSTPIGRVLNRFSRDTEVLDNEISNQLRLSSFLLSTIAGILILCIVYLPWFAIAIPVLLFFCFALSSFYQASSREIKRIDSINRSFVFSRLGEILNGMETIKIYKAEERFSGILNNTIDNMNEAYFLTITNQRFLGVNMSMYTSVFSLLIALLCVFKVFNISASSTGLMLSYVVQITNYLNLLLRSLTQVENQMNSAERLFSYDAKLIQEAPYRIEATEPGRNWPQNGEIVFKDVDMSYTPDLPNVLKKLNFSIRPQEKIGICGRTGAGKSSLTSVLFRLVEIKNGSILIDGVDISKIGLASLRSKLTIIPQDPVLFKGTIRRNLDPFEESDDASMLGALLKVGLLSETEYKKAHEGIKFESKYNLDAPVQNNGINFSLGEKQLISFARALVRGNKILILDEATSLVDYESDRIIQETIAREFSDRTILCIAHRLKTILNYDRIIVMDKGAIIECDSPLNLYNNGGVFYEMCTKANITLSDFKHE